MAGLRDALRTLALKAGYFVGTSAPVEQVRAHLAQFWPVETSIPLVRLGSAHDGGYLVPDDLEGIVACFSPGVDVTADFEADLVARRIPCFLADASVEGAPIAGELVDFEKKFIGPVTQGDFITLDDWIAGKAPAEGDLLLQMDIEGHEWAVLLGLSDTALQRFRIAVLELHGLPDAFNTTALRIFEACMARLSRHFHVVHAHPNNVLPAPERAGIAIPPFLEVTLLRKDRARATGPARRFPHPLDATNVPGLPDYPLPAAMRAPA